MVVKRFEGGKEQVGRHAPEKELDEFEGHAHIFILSIHLDVEACTGHLHVGVGEHIFDSQREVQVIVEDTLGILDEVLMQG